MNTMSHGRMRSLFAAVLGLLLPVVSFAAEVGRGPAAGVEAVRAISATALPGALNAPALPNAPVTAQLGLPSGNALPGAAAAPRAGEAASAASAAATMEAAAAVSASAPASLAAKAPRAAKESGAQAPAAPAALPQAQAAASGVSDAPSSQAAPVSGEAQAANASEVFDDAQVRGKTLMLVGTRSSRPFILDETVRVARELGLKLIVLDKPENRKNSQSAVKDADFIPAPIDQRDDASMKRIVDEMVSYAKRRKIDAVAAFRSHHAKLVGRIVDALKVIGVPKKPVVTADNKVLTRQALNTVPELAVPSRKVVNAADARKAFREFGGGKFVMKSVHGENSRFVEIGLDTEEKVEAAYRKMDADLKAYAKLSESSDTIFNRYPGILLERQLETAPGTVEASVELVVRNGQVVFAMVSDTHGIGANGELAGGSMTYPSTQPQQVQQALIDASAKALAVIGIHNGNARTDVFMTPDGPRIIEVNPYLGGAAIWKAIKLVTGVSLVEYGIRALLNLATPPQPASKDVLDYRFAAAPATGVIEAIEGLAEAEKMPGVRHLQVLASVGDRISAPIGNGFEEWLEIMAVGQDLPEARRRSVEALSKIKLRVRQDDGTVVEATGAHLQPGN